MSAAEVEDPLLDSNDEAADAMKAAASVAGEVTTDWKAEEYPGEGC